jgi:hypothetical protein
MDLLTYEIDASDTIVRTGADWDAFATANGAAPLAQVRGRRLWDFLSLEAAGLYRIVVDRVREGGISITLPYRCDAPTLRRFCTVTVWPQPRGGVHFDARTLRVERRPAVRLLDPQAPRSEVFVSVCSWCKRVAAPEWMEIEDAVGALGLDAATLPQITHGMCPACERTIKGAVDGYQPGR